MKALQFDVFLFDLDGVLYVENTPQPGARKLLAQLRRRGKTVRFLTNDPRPTRQTLSKRLQAMGFEAALEEITTCGWATARHLKQQNVQSAYVLGSSGLRTEISRMGITISDQPSVDAVVVGCSASIGYEQIRTAVLLLHQGAQYIATNNDGSFPTTDGPAPATGAIAAAVTAASGQQPKVVGKPYPAMFTAAMAGIGSAPKTVMIGDRIDTDILGAHRFGLSGVLVGGDADRPSTRPLLPGSPRQPDGIIKNLSELHALEITPYKASAPKQWPDKLQPGVGIVAFNRQGAVLLIQQARNDHWSLPMGPVEPGESVKEAAKRKLESAAGCAGKNLRLSAVYSRPDQQTFTAPSGQTVHLITTCFTAEVGAETSPAPAFEEVHQASFFPPNTLPENLLSIHNRWITDALETRNVIAD